MIPRRHIVLSSGSAMVFDEMLDAAALSALSAEIIRSPLTRSRSFNDDLHATLPAGPWEAERPLAKLLGAIVSERFSDPDDPIALSHVIVNAISSRGRADPHTDQDCPRCATAVVYASPVWRPEWGGETCFFDERDGKLDTVACVSPKPGRILVFRSQMHHRGGVPQRGCPAFRYTLVAFYNCRAHTLREVPGYGLPGALAPRARRHR